MTTLVRAVAALGLVFVTWLLWGSRSREEVMRAPIVRLVVKHPWLTAGAMGAVALAIAAIAVISGAVPIKASSGHWRITAAFLDFAKVRSVSTHSWGIDAPPLDDQALILRGAGHYETACLPCHGGPGRSIPPVMRAMTPPPPELSQRITRWTPTELFSIVKHGIKFTGMPAWPVQRRDDEVWAVVAFLRRLPELDAAGYRDLVYGELDLADAASGLPRHGEEPPPRAVREVCWRCHGANGTGRGPGAFPSLAGQRSEYLDASLRAFRNGTRLSGIMGEIAAKLSDGETRHIAAYYERLVSRTPDTIKDETAVQRGRAIAGTGVSERDIPACVECHGPTGFPKSRAYPRLTAQHLPYLTSQLVLFRERRRGGTANIDLMHVFVNRLRDDEIRDVASYFASLPDVSDPPPQSSR
jgi:cytochrome c553/cytochrome c5